MCDKGEEGEYGLSVGTLDLGYGAFLTGVKVEVCKPVGVCGCEQASREGC